MKAAGKPPLTLEEAQSRLLALATPLPIEHVDVEGSVGRYLGEPLHARRSQPAADLSAMDGYAVTADDMIGPWRVIGESAAGHPYSATMSRGEAVRISTGAMMPADAAAVILQEDVARQGNDLVLSGEAPSPPHRYVRARGQDFTQGAAIMPEGTWLGPAQVAIAIAAGHTHVPARRRPRVVIIDGGDELSANPDHCEPHQVPASNGAMLQALLGTLSADVRRIGPLPDTIEAITSAFDASVDADLIVTSGGASVGKHDLVRPALERWGAALDFWRVAIKPGKPLLVAVHEHEGRRQLVLGLPGNPVSSFVTAYLFLLPLLRTMMGSVRSLPTPVVTRLGTRLAPGGDRREFLRATWDGRAVSVAALQDSAALSSLAAANVLVDRPAHSPALAAGDEVEIYLLDNGGIA